MFTRKLEANSVRVLQEQLGYLAGGYHEVEETEDIECASCLVWSRVRETLKRGGFGGSEWCCCDANEVCSRCLEDESRRGSSWSEVAKVQVRTR